MTYKEYAWLIPLLPTIGFLINIILGYKLGNKLSAYLSLALMLASTTLAGILLTQAWQASPSWDKSALHEIIEIESELKASPAKSQADLEQAEHHLHTLIEKAQTKQSAENFPFTSEHTWLKINGEEGFTVGLFIDPFAAVMTFMVAFICMLIHLFSVEYMAKEARYPTFFAYISLFSAAMLAMVLSRNLFHVLLFWEVMGVMSLFINRFFLQKNSCPTSYEKSLPSYQSGRHSPNDRTFLDLPYLWHFRHNSFT